MFATDTLFAGSLIVKPCFSSTTLSAGSFPSLPSLATVTLPLSSTVMSSSVNPKSGFAALIASFTACFSSGVNASLFATDTLFAGALMLVSSTVSACASWPTFLFSPSPVVTVTNPSFATTITAFSGKSGFAFLTASFTAVFSDSVRESLSETGVFSGAISLRVLSVSLISSTVSVPGILPVFVSPIGTVTVPSSSTWISSSVNPRSGLAFLISSFTACFSCSVSLLVFPTFTLFSGGFNVLPSLVNGLTVSSAFKVPVLLPSFTVTLPLLSTSIVAVSGNEFFSLTAAATLSLSSCVKFVRSFTSIFSGAVKSRIVSFCTTVWSGVNEPTLPPWLIFTDPSSFTVMSSSVKFLSGFATLIASLTACFSSVVKEFLFTTGTGSFGGLKLFWTSFCLTVFSGANVPVLPSFVTVTVPSSATVMSAFVKVGLAAITASITLSFSSLVRSFRSLTSTGVGSAKVNGSLSVFSQTAYTVLGASTLFKMLASASVASFVAAQPLKVYPSLVGSVGFVTVPSVTFTVVCSFSSANLPPLASNVTAVSSE